MGFMLMDNALNILLTAPLAILTAWAILRGLDKLNNRRFTDAYDTISQDPGALARYLSLRFLGVCILVGLVVLKSV